LYEKFFQLPINPFLLTPDPHFAAPTPSYREAFAALIYALHWRKGFVALSAEPGTGKTTLLSAAMRALSADEARFSYVINPTLTPSEFVEAVMLDFGIANVPASKARRLQLLEEFLLKTKTEGRTAVLIIDEAHRLTAELLEELRFLTNFENAQTKLLQVVLAGQPEMDATLNREDLRQVRQRISLRLTLSTLTCEETGYYLRHRWAKSGTTELLPFSEETISAIARVSNGTPRTINVLCDNCLALAFGLGVRLILPVHVAEVASSLQMDRPRIPAKPEQAVAIEASIALPETSLFQSIRSQKSIRPEKPPLIFRIASRLGFRVANPVTE
jgi:general secretion pathway protein A